MIITIIVLLILAGVSISALVGENGVLKQAISAVDETNLAKAQEAIETAIASCQSDFTDEYNNGTSLKFSEWLTTEKLNCALKNEGYYLCTGISDRTESSTNDELAVASTLCFTANENNQIVYCFKLTGGQGAFDLSIGNVTEGIIKWYYNDDESITNGTTILKIGDYINYNAVTNSTVLSYTSKVDRNGYDSDQTFTLTSDNDYTWQILGVDENTGEILIVMKDAIYTDDNEAYYLRGKDGYENGVIELNRICNLFGQGIGASGARSVKVEDVNKLTGFNPSDIDGQGTPYASGTISEYGSEASFYWDGTELPHYYISNGLDDKLVSKHSNGFFWYEDGWQYSSLSVNDEYITKIITTHYWYTSSEYPNSLVYPSSRSYWLANTSLRATVYGIQFALRGVDASQIYYGYMFYSNGQVLTVSRGVRAVVSLENDIQLTGDSENGWNIVEF